MKILPNISFVVVLLLLFTINMNAQVPLSVEQGTDASLSDGSGYLVLGNENFVNIVIDNNEILARNNGSPSSLFLNVDGGLVEVGSTASQSNLSVKGYTRLGNGAPLIRTKLVTGTTASATTILPHGLPDQSKIIAASIVVEADLSGNLYHEHYTVNWHDQTNVAATGTIPNGSDYKLYVTYIQ